MLANVRGAFGEIATLARQITLWLAEPHIADTLQRLNANGGAAKRARAPRRRAAEKASKPSRPDAS